MTEKENDRVKDFFLSGTIKRNARAQSSHNLNFSSSVERSCGGIDDADICNLSEKSFLAFFINVLIYENIFVWGRWEVFTSLDLNLN